MTGVIGTVCVFETQRPNCRNLRDILARLRPVEMPRTAGKYYDRARWVRGERVAIECMAQTDVENTRDNRVDTVFRMPMRHQLCTHRRLHTNDVWPGFRR